MSGLVTAHLPSPLGVIVIKEKSGAIVAVDFVSEYSGDNDVTSPLMDECKKQLKEYFDGTRTQFSLPLGVEGTEFQKEVWNAVSTVPFGNTASYKEIGIKLNKPDAVRAIGSANGQNKILLLIPCHRIIGQDGSLVGYAGELWRKEWLLHHEAKFSGKPQQLPLF